MSTLALVPPPAGLYYGELASNAADSDAPGGTTAVSERQIFGPSDGLVVGGVPQVTPTTETAIYIDSDGTQYQYFGGAWH